MKNQNHAVELKFLVFERNDKYEKMNSRLSTLLRKVKMQSQYITADKKNLDFNNLLFDKAHQIIKKEKEKAIEYLVSELIK